MTYDFKAKSRFFNQVTDYGEYFEKISRNGQKLREEFNFYSHVPIVLQEYYPKVFDFQVEAEVTFTFC